MDYELPEAIKIAQSEKMRRMAESLQKFLPKDQSPDQTLARYDALMDHCYGAMLLEGDCAAPEFDQMLAEQSMLLDAMFHAHLKTEMTPEQLSLALRMQLQSLATLNGLRRARHNEKKLQLDRDRENSRSHREMMKSLEARQHKRDRRSEQYFNSLSAD